MALTATIYNFSTQLSDIDRGVYETFDVRMAKQPSETIEFMLTRFLAYCLEYTEGIELTEGVAAGDLPAVLVRDLTGRVTAWIEVGAPDAERLHRGSKLAGRAAVYTHRNIRQVLSELSARKVHGGEDIPIYAFEPRFIEEVAATLDRRVDVSVSVTERQLYLDVNDKHFETTIAEHRLA
ncbi:MAG: YaeQ family protein [Acidobacteria bacterium]|nr:YaeQ family protein [Acidobacteriota bacterium]